MVEFREGKMSVSESVTYNASEFALVYTQSAPQRKRDARLADRIDEMLAISRGHDSLLIADTLAIVFSRDTGELKGFDAYTNHELWERSGSIDLPELSGSGSLYLAGSLPDTPHDLSVIPRYVYSGTGHALCILLGRSSDAKYHRVSDRLVVGIAGNSLTTLLVEGLAINR